MALWPAPLPGGSDLEDERRTWVLLRRLLAELPTGSWTTFGDLATVIGSTPAAVGTYMASRPGLENAHRVLTSEGTVSPSFRWPDDRAGAPRDVLESEGVTFSNGGAADPTQRLAAKALAKLIGMDAPEDPEDDWDLLADRFEEQLSVHGDETFELAAQALQHWADRGGNIDFGRGATETSCFPWLDRADARGWIWPVVFYPRGATIEVVFQHLAKRPPFDDMAHREEFRRRLNRIDGVDIPADRLTKRPSFPITALSGDGMKYFTETLDWFMDEVGTARPPEEAAATEPDDSELAAEFHSAMLLLYARTKTEAGYNASAFLSMVTEHGGVGAAKRLLASPQISDGFAALHERDRLDLSVEAHVTDPCFTSLFSEEERDRAAHRLAEAGYKP
ncbi:MGMT family protein [Actinomadura formosensis]|uniref:MGMT family protein n=1 Tax=Actinomadura formosensis TaxID=60706 RepID=UPI000B1AC747|nr:MGMT family protein [Actinomadura formosensis]